MILNIFEIKIHFAIPILLDIVTNNGVINPMIRNLIPYINKIIYIGNPALYNITVPKVSLNAFAKLYENILKYIYLYSLL